MLPVLHHQRLFRQSKQDLKVSAKRISVTQEPKEENRNPSFFGKEVSTSHRNDQEKRT